MPITVIVADDHAIFRQGLAFLLQAESDITLLAHASNGSEAWGLIESLRPDVAILDLSMPESTGIEVARRVEAAGLDTRVVLLTMHDDPSAVLQAQETGVAGYILKDNSFEELVQAVHAVAAGGTFITPSIRAKLRAIQRNGRPGVPLSSREREVIRLIALGNSSKETARILGLSPRTVETYRSRSMDKLGLHALADLVRYAVQAGMVG
jgi:DNA-binding NarL/FixJ family response regulator